MNSLPHSWVELHTSEPGQVSVPSWFAETVVLAEYLRSHSIFPAIGDQVRLVRGRFGQYEVIDFLALLFGYAASGERTLQGYFTRLVPFATPFMALFARDHLPHRATLSRFLADVDVPCLEAFRALFVASSYRWGWTQETIGGLWDRAGHRYLVFDIDGTREAARQRALPTAPELPPPGRRLDDLCGPGYKGRRRGEVVRTRTVVEQMHTHQWLGTFGGRGNGDYCGELVSALQAIVAYLTGWQLVPEQAIVRLDGQYGDGKSIAAIFAVHMQVVVRCRTYTLLEHPQVQAVLTFPPEATVTTRESQVTYELFDIPGVSLSSDELSVRVILARRAWLGEPHTVGKLLEGWIYELFLTTLPSNGFHATDVVDLYHGRGAFEGTLADEDREGDPDRWCSYAALGQELWQIVWQWVWNLRLVLAAGCSDTPNRTLEWAPSQLPATHMIAVPDPAQEAEYGPLHWAQPRGRASGRLGAEAFTLQADGWLQCPTGVRLWHSETQQENAFTQRLVFTARDDDCAPCPLRASCLGRGASGKRGRRVSAVRHQQITAVVLTPTPSVAAAAMLWKDVAGRLLRRTWMAHWRSQVVSIAPLPFVGPPPLRPPRAERSHRRLSWEERLRRNARDPLPRTTIYIAGVSARLLLLLQACA